MAANSGVTTTLVIEFGDTEQGSIAASLDSERNNGKATFSSGDSVFFRVWSEVPYSIMVTSGTVAKIVTAESEEVTGEIITFANTNLSNAQFFVDRINSTQWLGNNLGNITPSKFNNVYVQNNPGTKPLGAAIISYDTSYDVWKLTAPTFTGSKYAIVVLIAATA